MAEGGRTAPMSASLRSTFFLLGLSVQCVATLQRRMFSRAILDSDWAEDRATVGTDPSADPVAETGDGAARFAPLLFSISGIGTNAINPGGFGGLAP